MFQEIKTKVQTQFAKLSANPLFRVEVDRDKIWEVYLNAFAEDKKQENNCNCCKSFLRQFAGIVSIENGKTVTLFDFEVDDEEYKEPIKAVGRYVRGLPIAGIYMNDFKKCGTDKNLDQKRSIFWEHFFIELPSSVVKKDFGPVCADALDNKNVLKRSLEEITDDAVDTVLELIGQNSLYRGNEFAPLVKDLQKVKNKYKTIKGNSPKDNFCWLESRKISAATCRIKNSAIGTLLNNLSEGMELDKAVSAFEKVVAPTNYKRPVAIATPKMIDAAKARLQELGLIGALNRRMLSERDLSVANVLFVDRPQNKGFDPFEDLKKGAVINPKTLKKIEEISINDFVEKVLPTAKSINALIENNHFGNFASLIGPKEPDSGKLFKWDNEYSWSYSGGVSDGIKERVKAAGGNVEGVLRVSLSWDNKDDLDLWLIEPDGNKVYYGNRRQISKTGATLDLDANGSDGNRDDPCENIYWTELPRVGGTYEVIVNQFNRRESRNSGFTLQLEFDGQTYEYSCTSNGNTGHNHKMLKFNYTKKDGFSILGGKEEPLDKYHSKEKWGIKSGVFHKIKSIVLSPNFWGENKIGNKHFFFMLEGCKTDEAPKPFLNEFLNQSLDKERKTMEMLNSKFIVEKVDDELSGLGFSETVRAELICEVTGSFKRILRVKF